MFLFGIFLLTAVAYLPGLNGPFIFDDVPNIIQPLGAWLNQQTGWQEIIFGNGSGMLRRPIANASFLVQAATTGLEVWPFKLLNLLLHLACGALVYVLTGQLLRCVSWPAAQVRPWAMVLAACWLLHPMQVSTVLYVVQRMAQLSTFFIFLGLVVYIYGRHALQDGQQRKGWACLWLVVPVTTLLAMLSKENGALLPLLCAVIEVGCFSPRLAGPRPRSIIAFFVLFLVLPLLAGMYLFGIVRPVHESYSGRLFTMHERLLSETRVLWEYVAALLWPRGPALGIYSDDFVVSRGWLEPVSTLLSALGWLVVVAVAVWQRHRMPLFFTGVGLYLGGHLVESTVFPLQIYFEHRNYFPAAGLFLAVVALCAAAIQRWQATAGTGEQQPSKLVLAMCIAVVCSLSLATAARSYVWSSMDAIAAQGAEQRPQSMRAQIDYANSLQLQGRIQETAEVFQHMQQMDDPSARNIGWINALTLQCMAQGSALPASVDGLRNVIGSKLQLAEMLAFENLGNYLRQRSCEGVEPVHLANLIVEVVNAADQPQNLIAIWRNRFVASQIYAQSGEMDLALYQAALAWMSGSADTAVGIYLANLYRLGEDYPSALLILQDVERKIKNWDQRNRNALQQLRSMMEQNAG